MLYFRIKESDLCEILYTEQKYTINVTISKIFIELQFISGNQSIEINSLGLKISGFHMTGNIVGQRYLYKKGRGVDQKTSQYLL
jgi:hypothetical protein